MKGTWGKRVFGWVRRGQKYTRFYISVDLDSGLTVYRTKVVENDQLDRANFNLYGYTLDKMVEEIDKNLHERHQTWMQQ